MGLFVNIAEKMRVYKNYPHMCFFYSLFYKFVVKEEDRSRIYVFFQIKGDVLVSNTICSR